MLGGYKNKTLTENGFARKASAPLFKLRAFIIHLPKTETHGLLDSLSLKGCKTRGFSMGKA